MNFKSSPVVYIVVIGQVALSLICVGSICLSLFYKVYSDPATLSALILLTGTLVGNLGSILGGPRGGMMMGGGAPAAPQEEKILTEGNEGNKGEG